MRPDRPPPLARADAPESDVVLSSRVRLARNVAGECFVHRCSESAHRAMLGMLQQVMLRGDLDETLNWVDLETVSAHDRQLLVERHLISRHLAETNIPRGVAIADDETMSVMVNEEDHVRMQAIAPGLQPERCLRRLVRLDAQLETRLNWAMHEQWGYLCACPTNAGTGIRFSAMVHLPALRMTGELSKVQQAAKDLHLAVRGYYGEGSESSGNFYQISNQITLGVSEEELLDQFQRVLIPGVVRYERAARDVLLDRERLTIEDRVHRDLAILRSARLLKADEAMKRLSNVRLGACMGLIDTIGLDTINALFLHIQPAHLRERVGGALSPADARGVRAELVRNMLSV
ncbi:MAG: protein arginine kinase [Phycisphaerales bacterium]|nr:protein arginine kinase [Phycisphaerales bacterium]